MPAATVRAYAPPLPGLHRSITATNAIGHYNRISRIPWSISGDTAKQILRPPPSQTGEGSANSTYYIQTFEICQACGTNFMKYSQKTDSALCRLTCPVYEGNPSGMPRKNRNPLKSLTIRTGFLLGTSILILRRTDLVFIVRTAFRIL